jgi:hypothetical protein
VGENLRKHLANRLRYTYIHEQEMRKNIVENPVRRPISWTLFFRHGELSIIPARGTKDLGVSAYRV